LKKITDFQETEVINLSLVAKQKACFTPEF
jgi:hypothetical protein